ncbi:MAG: hypothetical protein ACI4OT_05735 [Bacilli bacterium]
MKKFIKGLSNFILIVILFSTISLITISYGIDSSFSYKNIKNIVKTTIKENIENKNNEIIEPIYEKFEKYNIPKENIDKILENEKIQDLTTDLIYYSFIENSNNLSQEEINTTIDEVITEINKDKQIINNDTKEEIKSIVSNNYYKLKNSTTVNNNLTKEQVIFNKLIKLITNRNLRIIGITSIIASIILIILINFNNLTWLKMISITLLISEITILIFSYITVPIINILINSSIGKIVNLVLMPIHKYSLIMTIIAIFMLIFYCILKKMFYKKN